MQIWKLCDKKWRHNDIITNNNEKMRTSAKPNKLYIIRKVLMRAIQKCTFYWIWVTMSKVMGIYVKFWYFLRCPLSKYGHHHVTQEANFKKIYLFLILHLTLDKAATFLVEKFSTLEVISQKPHGGGKHPPSAFRVNQQKMRTQPIHHTTNLQTMCPANFRIRLLFYHNNFGHNHQRNSTVPEQIYSACPAFTKIHQCKAAAWFLWPSIRERLFSRATKTLERISVNPLVEESISSSKVNPAWDRFPTPLSIVSSESL